MCINFDPKWIKKKAWPPLNDGNVYIINVMSVIQQPVKILEEKNKKTKNSNYKKNKKRKEEKNEKKLKRREEKEENYKKKRSKNY